MIEHKMLQLFGGNMTAYGRDGNPHPIAIRGPITPQLVLQHLEGTIGIGIYPMWQQNNQWWVKWGCCDIDTGDWSEAYGLVVTLRSMGFTPMVERSRSKGWHVWVFADGPVLAAHMRRALKVAYATIGLQAREANPKAETLIDGQLGNYVRLPFKAGLVEHLDRQVMMSGYDRDSDGLPVQATDWFNGFEPTMRIHPDVIGYWASKWKEPKKPVLVDTAVSEDQLRRTFGALPEDLFRFVCDGPNGSGDRSEALVALAFKLKKAGLTPAERLAVIKAADARWGKYSTRFDGESYLIDIVERTL